jgi:hypothetical protein
MKKRSLVPGRLRRRSERHAAVASKAPARREGEAASRRADTTT